MNKLIPILLASILLLCGCSAREINDTSFVVAIGIDESDDNDYVVSFLTAIPETIISKEGNSEKVKLNTFKTKNVISATDRLADALNKKIDFSHCRVIAFSQQLAEDGLGGFKKTLLNEKEFRPDTLTVITTCSPKDFFNYHTDKITTNPSKYFELMFNSQYAPTSLSYTIKDFSADVDMVIPTIDLENNRGGGILKNHKLVGTLTPKEIILYKLLKSDLSHSHIDFLSNNFILSTYPEKEVEIKVKNKRLPQIFITLYLNGEFISEEKNINYRKSIGKLSGECETFINNVSEKYDCDILSCKKRFRPLFLTLNDYNTFINGESFNKAVYDVKIIYSDIKTGERIFEV